MNALQLHRRSIQSQGKRKVKLAFNGICTVGGDQTYFVDKVELIDINNNVVDAGLINADLSYPPQGNGYFAYLGGNTDPKLGWTFGNNSGIATNNSAFEVPNTPDGNAVIFIQGNSAETYQYMSLAPGQYKVRFLAAQRNNVSYNDGYVRINDENIFYLYPERLAGFKTYITPYFTVY